MKIDKKGEKLRLVLMWCGFEINLSNVWKIEQILYGKGIVQLKFS